MRSIARLSERLSRVAAEVEKACDRREKIGESDKKKMQEFCQLLVGKTIHHAEIIGDEGNHSVMLIAYDGEYHENYHSFHIHFEPDEDQVGYGVLYWDKEKEEETEILGVEVGATVEPFDLIESVEG